MSVPILKERLTRNEIRAVADVVQVCDNSRETSIAALSAHLPSFHFISFPFPSVYFISSSCNIPFHPFHPFHPLRRTLTCWPDLLAFCPCAYPLSADRQVRSWVIHYRQGRCGHHLLHHQGYAVCAARMYDACMCVCGCISKPLSPCFLYPASCILCPVSCRG